MSRVMNSEIVRAETVRRPLTNTERSSGPACHSGTRVHTRDGSSYLIHSPGPGHSTTGSVVTDASNMSNRWETVIGVFFLFSFHSFTLFVLSNIIKLP